MSKHSLKVLALAGIAGVSLAAAQAQITPRPMLVQTAPALMLNIAPEASAQLSQAQKTQLDQLRLSRGVAAIHVARLSPQALTAAGVGKSLQLSVAPDVSFTARTLAVEDIQGGKVWRGEVASASQGTPPGQATFVVRGEQITGSIHGPNGELYQVRPLPGGASAILRFDYRTAPQDDPADVTPSAKASMLAAPGALSAARALPLAKASPALQLSLVERYKCLACLVLATTPKIDVLVAYTPAAAMAAGDINGLIDLAMAETNDSFVNSGVNARLRLVGTMPVGYADAGKSFDQMVGELANPFDGKIDNVHAQREAVKADVVVMIINNTAYCGMADDIGATPATAFVVVHYGCATGYYSFGHEIGHLLGARHDPATDGTPTPFAYGHGFRYEVPAGGWRTIMSYRCSSGNCDPRLQYWSAPGVSYDGRALGVAGAQDNASVWNARAATVAGFR